LKTVPKSVADIQFAVPVQFAMNPELTASELLRPVQKQLQEVTNTV
jgi:hypothetical protein